MTREGKPGRDAAVRDSTADFAVDAKPDLKTGGADAPPTRHVEPLGENEKPDQMAEKEACAESRQEALLDEAIEETFPGSDPISPKHIT
ncbi:MAG: hypothetical protein ACM3W4_06815 [Ignavibacteriales bacterium]